MDIEGEFELLRKDKRSNLGLGDVRLTMDQQDKIIRAFKEAEEANKNLMEEYQCALSNSVVECREMRKEITRLKALIEKEEEERK